MVTNYPLSYATHVMNVNVTSESKYIWAKWSFPNQI